MSHYCVAVISKKNEKGVISALLEPYKESKKIEYRDCTEEVLNAWNTGKSEYGTEINHDEYENSIEKFADEYFGYEVYKEDDYVKYGYWYNPNAKWDWYSIGGRWNNFLKLKRSVESDKTCSDIVNLSKPECTNVAQIKDIDFSLNKEDYNSSIRFWELYIEDQEPKNKKEKELKVCTLYKKEFYINRYKTKENYAKSVSSFSTFAVVTEEGWFEQCQMGWFGLSNETDDEAIAWVDNYYDRFIKNADPESYITIVDCHI